MITSHEETVRITLGTVLSVTASKFLFVLSMKMKEIFSAFVYTQKYELDTLFRKTHIL